MTSWIDVLTDLDFELISMTDDELHVYAMGAVDLADFVSGIDNVNPIHTTRQRTASVCKTQRTRRLAVPRPQRKAA